MTILDLVAKKGPYTPSTVEEFVALKLALRLSDIENAGWYRHIAHRYTIAALLQAYSHATRSNGSGAVECFRSCLAN